MQQLDYKNGNGVFYVVRAEEFSWTQLGRPNKFCTEVCEERTWAGGREIAIVGAITRERLVTDWEH
jgi:hypothetical protein